MRKKKVLQIDEENMRIVQRLRSIKSIVNQSNLEKRKRSLGNLVCKSPKF